MLSNESSPNQLPLRSLLFYVDTAPAAAELLRIAIAFQQHSSINAYFFMAKSFMQVESFSAKCQEHGFVPVSEAECSIVAPSTQNHRIPRQSISKLHDLAKQVYRFSNQSNPTLSFDSASFSPTLTLSTRGLKVFLKNTLKFFATAVFFLLHAVVRAFIMLVELPLKGFFWGMQQALKLLIFLFRRTSYFKPSRTYWLDYYRNRMSFVQPLIQEYKIGLRARQVYRFSNQSVPTLFFDSTRLFPRLQQVMYDPWQLPQRFSLSLLGWFLGLISRIAHNRVSDNSRQAYRLSKKTISQTLRTFNRVLKNTLKFFATAVGFIVHAVVRLFIMLLEFVLKVFFLALRQTLKLLIFVFRRMSYFKLSRTYWLDYYRNRISFVQSLIQEYKIDLLVLAKDSVYYDTCCWVKASQDKSIPVVMIPFDIADTKALLEHRVNAPEHQLRSRLDRIIMKKYPRWVRRYKDRDLILFSVPQIVAVSELGMAPPNPWAYNSSNCDRIFVDNEFHRSKLVNEGKSKSSVILAGHIYQDLMSSQLFNTPQAIQPADSKKIKVLISIPPDKLVERGGSQMEFTSYSEMLSCFVKTVCDYRDVFAVTLCVHPSVKYQNVAFLKDYGVDFKFEDTACLIAQCDVYIVDCSATSKWALAAGKLVIDYDMMQYNLEFHSKLDGIIWVKTQKEYADVISRLAAGQLDEFRKKVKENAERGYWGKLDGKAGLRIFQECTRLIELYKKQTLADKAV